MGSWVNFHTHSHFCDGHAALEDYVKAAIEKQNPALGFSGHSPVPFQTDWNIQETSFHEYLKEIDRLSSVYADQIKLYKGLEVDYITGLTGPSTFKPHSLDYTIGSVHFLGKLDETEYWGFDFSPEYFLKGFRSIYRSDKKLLIRTYYEQIMEMIQKDAPDIIGHLDLIKKFNSQLKIFDENEDWYRDQVMEALEVIARSGCIVEVNTRGFYKGLNDHFYPSQFILEACYKKGIPLTINADAHNPGEINHSFQPAAEMLLEIGYRELYVLTNQGWLPKSFDNTGIISY